ncbi:MAG: immune inhibitor A [Krumholzibacteria bacterium]|nr:immune inhibitor A [Candidatus Krumholzibacteria bacterium]
MMKRSGRAPGRHLWPAGLLLAVLVLVAGMPDSATAQIPSDVRGLPLWVEAAWNDHPVRLDLADRAELDRLLAAVPLAGFDREQVRPAGGGRLVFTPRVTEAEAAALAAAGWSFVRLPDDDRAGRLETEAFWTAAAAKAFAGLDPDKALYYPTHAQIGSDLAALAAAHPTLARTVTMGTSVQGRALWGIVISDDVHATEPEPEVMLTGSIHGDEPVSMVLLWNLARHLLENYGQPGFEDLTALVDDTEIHILPLHNPDGYVAGTRGNANGVDLNRNYPEPAGTHPFAEQENLAYMAYAQDHCFVVSQNGHGGALVVNYPWDYTYTRAPDDAALIALSLEYSTRNLPMYNGSFPQGITNGADWYVITGSLQDWTYHVTGCINVTVELSNQKWPAASALDGYWEDNRESLLAYIAAARYGVGGVVTAADTGQPLAATVTVTGNPKSVATDPEHGDYYKLLPTGQWQLTFSAPGHLDKSIAGVATVWGTRTVLDVQLDPVAHGDVAGTVTGPGGQGLEATVAVYTLPLDQLYTTVEADGAAGGAYIAHLPYGDYRLEVSAAGYATATRTVTVGGTPASEDFVLGGVETVVLFAADFTAGADGWIGDWGLDAAGHGAPGSLADSPGADYAANATVVTTMAAGVDLTDALTAEVSFWSTWEIEDTWDACFFEISADGGAWTALGTAWTGPASGQGRQTPAGTPCFDGIRTAWTASSVDLGPYLGSTDLRCRFRLVTDSSINGEGFAFDDFAITITRASGSSPVPDHRPSALAVAAWPNPFNPATTVSFTVPRDGPVDLRIYDLRGRLVRTLAAEPFAAGVHRRSWDGRDDAGAPAGSGVYFALASTAEARAVAKLMLVK